MQIRGRSIIYIDGFNLYYGVIKDTPYKWLNISALMQRLRESDDIQQIYYFTAIVKGESYGRQNVYHRALLTCPLVKIVTGNFQRKMVHCRLAACDYPGPKEFPGFQEKRTDVNIAVQMINDAVGDNCERMVLVTADTDLVPVVEWIKINRPHKKLTVYVPSRNDDRGAAAPLRKACKNSKNFPVHVLPDHLFPLSGLMDGEGHIACPQEWIVPVP